MGHVIQAGAGQITARQAAVKGGIPMDVPALTVNKVCLSGLNAIAMADQLITVGEFDVVVAGGMESMTNGPYLLPGARAGYRYGDNKIIDATSHDALYCAFDLRGMGDSTDYYGKQQKITREAQDEYSAMSHERAAEARKKGLFDDEIVNVTVPQRTRRPDHDLRGRGCAAGDHRGVAGQASPGVLRGRHGHRRVGLADLRRRRGGGGDVPGEGRGAGCADPRGDRGARQRRRAGPVAAVPAVQRDPQGARPGRQDAAATSTCYEINEAFASVALQSMQDLEIDDEQRQRQRRRDLHGPPGRRLRRPGRAAPGPRARAAAAAGSAPPASAAAAARARPFSCTSTPDPPHERLEERDCAAWET